MCTVYSPSSFSAKTNFCIIVDTSTDRQTTARVPLPATGPRNEPLFLFAGAGEQNLGVCLTRPRESVFSKGNRKRDRDSSRYTHSCILRFENKTSHMYTRVAYFCNRWNNLFFLTSESCGEWIHAHRVEMTVGLVPQKRWLALATRHRDSSSYSTHVRLTYPERSHGAGANAFTLKTLSGSASPQRTWMTHRCVRKNKFDE